MVLEKLLAEAASFRASLCQLAGEFEQAQHLYAQALEIHRRRNNHIFTCATLGNMAATDLEMNQFDLAEARFGQVLSLASEAGLRRTLGIALGNYAILLSRTGASTKPSATFSAPWPFTARSGMSALRVLRWATSPKRCSAYHAQPKPRHISMQPSPSTGG